MPPTSDKMNYPAHRAGHLKKLNEGDCIPLPPAPHSSQSTGRGILREGFINASRISVLDDRQESVAPAKAGVPNLRISVESRFRGNDNKRPKSTFYGFGILCAQTIFSRLRHLVFPLQKAPRTSLTVIAFLLCLHFISPGSTWAAAPRALPDPDRLRYAPLSFDPPLAERIILANGMVVYLLEDRELPLLKITAVIRTGSIYDPPGQEGLAELTATMMETGGIAGMTGAAVDETLESMAALLQTSVNRDYGTFSLSLLRNDLEKGLELFSRILKQPAFEQDRLTLAKGLKIEELRRIGDDPQKLAFREFGRIIYEGNPWGSRFPGIHHPPSKGGPDPLSRAVLQSGEHHDSGQRGYRPGGSPDPPEPLLRNLEIDGDEGASPPSSSPSPCKRNFLPFQRDLPGDLSFRLACPFKTGCSVLSLRDS